MKCLSDYAYEKLKTSPNVDKEIEGVHCYDILANNLYLDEFQYFSASLENREKYIIDDDEDESNDCAQSDLVKMILNLAYLTEDKAKSFTFDKETYKQQVSGAIGNMLKSNMLK